MKRSFYITEHALVEMDNDGLEIEDVMRISESGTLLEDYPDDRPFPSSLKLGWSGEGTDEPVHVVSAKEPEGRIHIITAYRPDPRKWDESFKKRKK